MSAAACSIVRIGYHGPYKALALAAAKLVNSQSNEFRKSYIGLAAGTVNAQTGRPICRRTAQRGMAHLTKVGLFPVAHLGGGMRPGRNDAGECNTWRFNPDAEVLKGDKVSASKGDTEAISRLSKGDTVSPNGLKEANASLKPKTIKPARAKTGDKSPRASSTATSKAGLQESDAFRRREYREPLPVADADLNAYLSFACAFMAGTSTTKVRRAFFTAVRDSADKTQLLNAYRAHTAHCLRRGFGLKRPDRFLLDRAYLDAWPVVTETKVVAQGPSAAELESEYQAGLERLRAQVAEAEEVPADLPRMMAIISDAVATNTVQAPQRPRMPSLAALKPKPRAAPIDEPWEVYWTRAQASGFSEDVARRSWEGNRERV